MVQIIRGFLTILLIGIMTDISAQTTGGGLFPFTKHQPVNKSLVVNGARSLDAKFKYYDTVNFKERPFLSVTEANAYIPSAQRITGLTVFINTGGTLQSNGVVTGGTNAEYHYRNGTTDNDLVVKQSATSGGTVTNVTLTMPTGFSVSSSNTTTNATFNIASTLGPGFVKSSLGTFISSGVDTGDIAFFYNKVRALFTGSANISIVNGQIIYTGSAGSGGLSGFSFTNTTGITGTVTNPTTSPVLSLAITADGIADGSTNRLFTAAEKTKLAGIAAGAQVGTVTSVGISMPTGFSVGSAITTSGVISVTTTLNGILRGNGSGIVATTLDTTDIPSFATKTRSLFFQGTGITYNTGTGLITNNGVLSVNGNIGAITLDTGYIAQFAPKVRSLHSAGTGLSYNSGTGVYTNTGVLSINNTTGVLTMDTTYISSFATKVRSLFSVISGGTYNNATGQFTITGGSGTNDAAPTSGSTNGVQSGGVFNALGLKAPLASPTFTNPSTTTTPSVKDSSDKLSNTRYTDRAVYNAITGMSPIKYIQYANPLRIIQNVTINGDTVKFRGLALGTGLSVTNPTAPYDTVYTISVTANTYAQLAAANVFSNASYQSFIRSGSNGEAARFYGNGSGGHYVSIGTDASFGEAVISSDPGQRLDISAGGSSLSYMYLFGSQIFLQANSGVTRTADATSTATQAKSKDFSWETSMWNGTSAYNLYHGITTRVSTSVQGLAYLVFKTGNTTNPDLGGSATESLALGTDGSVAFPRMNNGGEDSLLRVKAGVVGKVACPECWTGTPTFAITSGAGTSPTFTLTPGTVLSNDYAGVIQITVGSSGTPGPLVSTLTFSAARAREPKVLFSCEGAPATGIQLYVEPSTTGFNLKSVGNTTNSAVIKVSYQVIP